MIIEGNWESFLNLKDEQLLFVIRRHIFTLIYPISLTIILASVFELIAFFLFFTIIRSLPLFVITFLVIATIALSLITYSVVYWYFHLYVLTNRKLLEVWYTPLFSHMVNDIFLDKVNCTEIDLSSNGFFHELIDMGNISITFDRPTHEEEFVLRDIKNCDALSKFLMQNVMDNAIEKREEAVFVRPRARFIRKVVV